LLSLSLSLSLVLFLLSSLLINKLDYWFRKPTGKRIDGDTGRERQSGSRETESVRPPTPLTFSGSLCMHKSSSERQINSSIGFPTHCNLKNNQHSRAYYMYYMVYYHLYLHKWRCHKHRGDYRDYGDYVDYVCSVHVYRIRLLHLGYWHLGIKGQRKKKKKNMHQSDNQSALLSRSR
jgi:hypothetical protein